MAKWWRVLIAALVFLWKPVVQICLGITQFELSLLRVWYMRSGHLWLPTVRKLVHSILWSFLGICAVNERVLDCNV